MIKKNPHVWCLVRLVGYRAVLECKSKKNSMSGDPSHGSLGPCWTHRGAIPSVSVQALQSGLGAQGGRGAGEPGRSSIQEVIRFAHRCLTGEGNSKERPAKLIWSRFWAPKLEHHGYILAFFEGTWTYEWLSNYKASAVDADLNVFSFLIVFAALSAFALLGIVWFLLIFFYIMSNMHDL